MIRNSYVIMTALVPTVGHAALIEFARNITTKHVIVAVQGRTFEPVPTAVRAKAIADHFVDGEGQIFVNVQIDDGAPQNPDPLKETSPGADVEFWEYWANAIRNLPPWYMVGPQDAIVASEPYGAILAQYLGCQFVPYDIVREIVPVKGSEVRQMPINQWDNILPTFKPHLQNNFVLFGQESVGKTTLSKYLHSRFMDSDFIPEYARGYLESVGPAITDDKLKTIELGQFAYQTAAYRRGNPINFFDTDLLSTIGYYRIFEGRMDDTDKTNDIRWHSSLVRLHHSTKNKMFYILLPDDIEFEKDSLRYGGDVRQSTYEFWKNLLDQYGCNYVEVPKGLDFSKKANYITHIVEFEIHKKLLPISNFERE